MTDMNKLRETAEKILDLSKTMGETLSPENSREHLIIAIMAGLQDVYKEGFDKGYCSRPA